MRDSDSKKYAFKSVTPSKNPGHTNRDDSNRMNDSAYKAFTRDKRTRIPAKGTSEKIEYNRPRTKYTPHDERDGSGFEKRKSFNPNFSSDNRFLGEKKHDGSHSRKTYQNDRTNQSGTNVGYGPDRREQSSHFEKKRPTEGLKKGGKYSSYGHGSAGNSKQATKSRTGSGFHTTKKYDAENYPKYPAPKFDTQIRLNRYIAMSGICSRREADTYIQAGVVSVNGQIVTELGTKVSQNDVIKFNDEPIQNEKKVYILMNKPKGYVTSLDDPHADKTVMELLKGACKERVYPVGRLDKNSLGVLLITNDGDLAKKLTHPTYQKKKVYQVTLDKNLSEDDMQRIVDGIVLEDGEIHADEISYISLKKNEIGLEIHSGRNRIVRRIFEYLGYRVQKLDRVYFAGLTKQKLKRGAWRFLTPKEVSQLKSGSYE